MIPQFHLRTVYQDDFAKVEVDETASFLYSEWFLHPDSQTLRRNFKLMADLAVENKIRY